MGLFYLIQRPPHMFLINGVSNLLKGNGIFVTWRREFWPGFQVRLSQNNLATELSPARGGSITSSSNIDPPNHPRKSSLVKTGGSLLGVCLFLVSFGIIHHELVSHNYHDIAIQIWAFPFPRLVLATGLTILNYLLLTLYDGLAVRFIGKRLQAWKMMVTSFIAYVFSYNVGLSVFGGTAIRYRMYSGFGFSARDVAKIVGFNVLTLWSGFFALAGAVFVFQPLAIHTHFALPFSTVRPLGYVFLLLVASYLAWSFVGKKTWTFGKWTVALPRKEYAVAQVLISSADWALAGGILFVLMPPDFPLSFFGFLAVFLLAQLTGLASHVPGGLGVFEGVVLLFLSPAVPAPKILAALLAFRTIYYFLPLLLAMVLLAGHELLNRKGALAKTVEFADKWIWGFIPQVFAVLTFISGIILLVSGVTPEVQGRLHWMRDFMPLPVVELSHFLGSLVGAALLFVAWGIHRRLNAAYLLTLSLLSGGILFSVFKGLDYEEALFLSLMAGALLPCRKYFYRRTSLVNEPFTFGWLWAIAGVLAFSIWLGLFSYKHVEYSDDLWWKFEFSAQAPRFLRAMVGVVGFAFVLAVFRLFHPPRIPQSVDGPVDMERIRSMVRESIRTSAHLALLGDKKFFFSDSGKSFLMYGVQGRSWIVMGDPVGPTQEWPDLIWTFRELCDRHNGWPVFYEVGHEALYLYVDLGLTVLKLGEEARVPLGDFSLEGGLRKDLRYTANKFEKEGFGFRITPVTQTPSMLPQLKHISDAWLHKFKSREKGFSLGFFDETYLKNFPIAVVDKGQQAWAFSNIWAGVQKEEMAIDLMRYSPTAPSGIMDYLFLKLMLWGKAEGYRWFNLGMAPLSGFQTHPLAPLWNKVGNFIFHHGEDFYRFEGLRAYKEKFHPVWRPLYMASPAGLQLPRIFSNVTRLISGGISSHYRGS